MSISKWLDENTADLSGKLVALTGSTDGIGNNLCRYLLSLGAELVLIDRNEKKQAALVKELKAEFTEAKVRCITLDLESTTDAIKVSCELDRMNIDVFIHNAGAYSIPRHKCECGYDNVFVINFLSPYCMIRELIGGLDKRGGRVIVVGSIAHNYSKTDAGDIDFSTRSRASLVYGNAKRYLMFSLYPLFDGRKATLAVTHPGITLTGITAHYPRLVFALIKHPMRVIFMSPRKAALSIIAGLFDTTDENEWIGPKFFNIWGYPKKKRLKTCTQDEAKMIKERAESLYVKISSSIT